MISLPLHISHSADAGDGGIATAVRALNSAQNSIGLDSTWLTADQFEPLNRDCALRCAVQDADPRLVHLHGLWRSPTRIARRLATHGLPLVIAPHGMLDSGALAISRRKKQLVWRLWERRSLQSSRCLHALCTAEAMAIRALLPQMPIAVIPNGVALPHSSELLSQASPPWADDIPDGDPVLLFLGRFHRKKGLDPLLSAWEAVRTAAERHCFWLALVGYGDDGALAQRVFQAQERGELQRVRVLGPMFGAQKAAALAAATAFVLPSFSEGLPMAALEAMAHKLPCLLSTYCNLPEAFSTGAALLAQPDDTALAGALENFFSLSIDDRKLMGHAGFNLVRDCFSWSHVASHTSRLYSWILDGKGVPEFVSLP